MIELSGSYGEGGGALIRTALALSTLTGKPFKINNIRSGRPKPGLKAQHLTAIKALKEICNAKTKKFELGTTDFWYHPGKIKSGTYEINIGTAGSITLLTQALILPCMFAPNKITLNITGGTCGKWQASVDYLQNVLLPHLKKFVDKIDLKILKRGYYPRGGGQISLEISPKLKLKDFENFDQFWEELQLKTNHINLIEQGDLEQIKGIINVSQELEEKEIAERIERSAKSSLSNYQVPVQIRIDYRETFSIGGELLLWTVYSKKGKVDFENPTILAGDALIEKNKNSEEVGKEAVQELKEKINSKTPVGEQLTDQLIQFISLLPNSTLQTNKISNHTDTNIYVTEKFLSINFKVNKKTNFISVEKISKEEN
jgi:RNA 3'-terminal phosphate cyclase (ATP)